MLSPVDSISVRVWAPSFPLCREREQGVSECDVTGTKPRLGLVLFFLGCVVKDAVFMVHKHSYIIIYYDLTYVSPFKHVYQEIFRVKRH